jgi:signal transduction histidine kinase
MSASIPPKSHGKRSLTTRLSLALALLLLCFGVFVAGLSRYVVEEYHDEELQRLSHGLARHIVEHWPEITRENRDEADSAARGELLSMLMVVNPGVQVYVLNAEGRVDAYIGAPGMALQEQVALEPVRRFLAGDKLPLRGSDPMNTAAPRLFSAAMFPPRAGDTRPPGYLYIVLDGAARNQVAASLSKQRIWVGAVLTVLGAMLATFILGLLVFRYLSLPLRRLAERMRDYSAGVTESGGVTERAGAADAQPAESKTVIGDEVAAIESAFGEMTQRIETQATRERLQTQDHRETMASVAHDLRTPLTALHGHLEALANPLPAAKPDQAERLLNAALAQSNKVRRLSQQLFELASLQTNDHALQREPFLLDELVTDTVQKFAVNDGQSLVMLSGASPGRLELLGDLHLVERALTNLIDNALRHAPSAMPVRVSLHRSGSQAEIWVEDAGPGLPPELVQRLAVGQSVREPPIKRSHGGIGGLGLAIAQRVALLHGGTLQPLPTPNGGTRLAMVLPLSGWFDAAAAS